MNAATPVVHPGLNVHASDKRATEPVTVSGWYEHTDGAVGYYQWVAGRLLHTRTAESWKAIEGED